MKWLVAMFTVLALVFLPRPGLAQVVVCGTNQSCFNVQGVGGGTPTNINIVNGGLPITPADGALNAGNTAFSSTTSAGAGQTTFFATQPFVLNNAGTWDRVREAGGVGPGALAVGGLGAVGLGPAPVSFAGVIGVSNLTVAPVASAANTAVAITKTGVAGTRICLRTLAIKATGAAATFTLTVSDGATIVLDLGTQTAALNGAADVFTGTPLMCASTGANLVVNIGAGGVGAITTTSVIADQM